MTPLELGRSGTGKKLIQIKIRIVKLLIKRIADTNKIKETIVRWSKLNKALLSVS